MSTDDLVKAIEVPTVVSLWGQKSTITPRVIQEVFGDGLQLIQISDIMRRPFYYVVRIDSRWHVSCFAGSDDECTPDNCLRENLDDIYNAIEDEDYDTYGPFGGEGEDDEEEDRKHIEGSSWGEYDWPGTKSHILVLAACEVKSEEYPKCTYPLNIDIGMENGWV